MPTKRQIRDYGEHAHLLDFSDKNSGKAGPYDISSTPERGGLLGGNWGSETSSGPAGKTPKERRKATRRKTAASKKRPKAYTPPGSGDARLVSKASRAAKPKPDKIKTPNARESGRAKMLNAASAASRKRKAAAQAKENAASGALKKRKAAVQKKLNTADSTRRANSNKAIARAQTTAGVKRGAAKLKPKISSTKRQATRRQTSKVGTRRQEEMRSSGRRRPSR